MTKYLGGSFNSPANNKNYDNNYDRVFGKKYVVVITNASGQLVGEEGPFPKEEAEAWVDVHSVDEHTYNLWLVE